MPSFGRARDGTGNHGDTWQTMDAAAAGLEPQLLHDLTERFATWKKANVHSILIARHGKLLYEQYFPGLDSRFGAPSKQVQFASNVPHDHRSLTKSVVALLVGVGFEKGWLRDLDQPIFSLLPSYSDLATEEKACITLRHLLSMSPGLAWNENLPYPHPENSETPMHEVGDPGLHVLKQPVVAPPGAIWNYNSGTTLLLGSILEQATGMQLEDLAEAHLFRPLGIQSAEWFREPQNGQLMVHYGLRMLPVDTLKLGQLVLCKGTWAGNQIVPSQWIQEAISPQISGADGWLYGFQFWLGRSWINQREISWAAGRGYGGQCLFIVPSLDLLLLVHAGLYESPRGSQLHQAAGSNLLNQFVLTGIKT
ncbi:MAG: serine hydrolase [Rhodospirillales bacterium]|nr:serine hydrolase [Rhodospirillales bacterium]